MTVPAEAALYTFTLHGLVARDDVLDGTRYKVPEVRETGCERGAVVKRIFGSVGPVADGFLENIVILPEGEDFFFLFGKIHFGINGVIHGILLLFVGMNGNEYNEFRYLFPYMRLTFTSFAYIVKKSPKYKDVLMAKHKITAAPSVRRLPSYLYIVQQAYKNNQEYISGTVMPRNSNLNPSRSARILP